MDRQESMARMPEEAVTAGIVAALTLAYSAPTPGSGSRYSDGQVAHETRMLTVMPLAESLGDSASQSVGETVLEAVTTSRSFAGFADLRSAGYLAPLARSALRGEPLRLVLRKLGHEDLLLFARAAGAAGTRGPLEGAIQVALGAGDETTLREVMRFVSARDPMAREYARNFEITTQLARPALISALSRAESTRAALVHCYLEVLSEVPDLDVTGRAGQREAEDVSRMAKGVLKSGSVFSRRGLQAITNLDGALRADSRLSPTATEPAVTAAAFLVTLEHGPESLNYRVRPARQR